MPTGYRKNPGPLLPDRIRHDGSTRRIGRAGSPPPGSWQAGSDAPAARESPANGSPSGGCGDQAEDAAALITGDGHRAATIAEMFAGLVTAKSR